MAEPGVARACRGQARRQRARQPVAPAPLDRRSRQLLAALLLQERHDRVLRTAGVGLVRRGGGRDCGPLGRAGARARGASRDLGGRGGGDGGGRQHAAADGPVPRARTAPLLADTAGLDRLEAARDAVASAQREGVTVALDRLDRVFEEVTGRPPSRAEGDSGGGRTIAYLDCMRDLDVTLGPAVLDELRTSLPTVLYASRWWCGRVFDRGTDLLGHLAHGRSGPLAPMLGELMGAGFGLWDQMGEDQGELQRRWAAVAAGEVAAADAFADWTPAWHGSSYHSADLQIAAASTDAVARGDFLIVLGDFHGGDNPLGQGLFGLRHPDPAAMMRRIAAEVGPGVHLSPPRHGAVPMTARSWPMYAEADTVVMSGDEPAPAGTTRIALEDVIVEDGQSRTARARSARRSRTSFPCRSSSPRCAASTRSARGAGARRSGVSSCAARAGRRNRAPGHARGRGRVGPRARPPAPRLRPLAARAQAQVRRLREPLAVPALRFVSTARDVA